MNRVGTKIRRIRESKDYTQEYMSGLLNVSQNTYSKIESGGVKLTVDRLKQIADILETTVEEVLSNDSQSFTFNNSHIDKFYGYIETLQEDNKDLKKKLADSLDYLQQENERLTNIIERLSEKIK